MRKTPLIVPILFLLAPAAGAQELSLDAAVGAAVEGNPEVFSARERAAAAGQRHAQVKGRRLPELNLSESFVYSNNPAEVFAMSLNQGRFDMEEFFLSDPNNPDPLSTWITSVELVLPLYTGGQLSTRTRQTEFMATAEERDYAHARQKVAFETITAYVNLAKAREHVALLEKARDTTAEHVGWQRMYAEQGMILQADVLQSQGLSLGGGRPRGPGQKRREPGPGVPQFPHGRQPGHSPDPVPAPSARRQPAATSRAGRLRPSTSGTTSRRRGIRLEAGRLEEKAQQARLSPRGRGVGHYDLFDDTIFGSNGHSGSIMAFAKINLFSGGSNAAARAAARHEAASFEADIRPLRGGRSSRGPAGVAEPGHRPHPPHNRRQRPRCGTRSPAGPRTSVQTGPRQNDRPVGCRNLSPGSSDPRVGRPF